MSLRTRPLRNLSLTPPLPPRTQPASGRCWSDVGYLRRTCGDRIVPVEVCAAADRTQTYLSGSWGQEVMTLGDYITKHVLTDDGWGSGGSAGAAAGGGGGTCAYLAQYVLFEQIPALKVRRGNVRHSVALGSRSSADRSSFHARGRLTPSSQSSAGQRCPATGPTPQWCTSTRGSDPVRRSLRSTTTPTTT